MVWFKILNSRIWQFFQLPLSLSFWTFTDLLLLKNGSPKSPTNEATRLQAPQCQASVEEEEIEEESRPPEAQGKKGQDRGISRPSGKKTMVDALWVAGNPFQVQEHGTRQERLDEVRR